MNDFISVHCVCCGGDNAMFPETGSSEPDGS